MPKRAKYQNPREYVKSAVVKVLNSEMEKEGHTAPSDIITEKADNILTEYEKFVVKSEHSYPQVIIDGFITNLLWWAFVVIISVLAFLSEHESIKTAIRDLLSNLK